jgi:hypothetical protein
MSIGTSAEIDKLINSENVTIEELQAVLKKISVLARKERSDETGIYIIGWILIIITVFSFFISYFLSIPLSIVTFLYFIINLKSDSFFEMCYESIKKLFFIENTYSRSILNEYVKGYRKTDMKTPIWSDTYQELKLELKIEELSRMNSKKIKKA